ncbi:hypothetical protein EDC01DRAFT_698636 [Geopyxis carbonaria]|nr:hypothetical protein EDC01DRAFT_698636 [Geopyxis carbonaria]
MPTAITSMEEYEKAMEESREKLVIIDCWAEWCGPCRSIAPVYSSLAADHPEAAFYKLDIDAAPQVAEELNVRSMPTFMFFRGGSSVDQVVGANPRALRVTIEKNTTPS